MTQDQQIGQPQLIPVLPAHRFDEAACARYLRQNLAGFSGELTIRQFVGGASNPTFLLEAGGNRWVLRKRPPGELLPSAHQVDREYRVMHALRESAVPVPQMFLFCDDQSIIGREFYVMECVEGRVMTSQLEGFTPQQRTAFYDDFVRVMAALHSVDHVAVGLQRHGRPGNYFARQIDRWSKQYRVSMTDNIADMEQLLEWMPAHIPAVDETAVIHGDLRVGNVLIHPTEPKIVAVLDWELSTLGHPMGDVGYAAAYTYHGEFYDCLDELPARGIPTEQQWCARYCELTGRRDIPHWRFYVAYNLFRQAAIVQGVYRRSLDGIASSEMDLEQHRQQVFTRAARAWAQVQLTGT